MSDTLASISTSDLHHVTGGSSSRSALLRQALHKQFGDIQMVGRSKFTAPPFNEGISTATGRFTNKGTGIPLVRSFSATVDAVRHKVLGLSTHVIAQ